MWFAANKSKVSRALAWSWAELSVVIPNAWEGREFHRPPHRPALISAGSGGGSHSLRALLRSAPKQPTKVARTFNNRKTDCAALAFVLMSDISVPCTLAGRPEDIK